MTKKGKNQVNSCKLVIPPPLKIKPLRMKSEQFHGLACPQYYLSNTLLLLKRRERKANDYYLYVGPLILMRHRFIAGHSSGEAPPCS